MIWPQTGSCSRREQLQKVAVDAVSVLLPHQLPAGASAFWPGLYVSDEDDKSDGYAESDAYDPYASEGEEPPSPPLPPQRCLRRVGWCRHQACRQVKTEVEAPGPQEVEVEAQVGAASTNPRRQRSPPDQQLVRAELVRAELVSAAVNLGLPGRAASPPSPAGILRRAATPPFPAALDTVRTPMGILSPGTRNLSALARARGFRKASFETSPRISKAEDERVPTDYYYGESWLRQLDCDAELGDGGELSPHARGFANHHADGYTSC